MPLPKQQRARAWRRRRVLRRRRGVLRRCLARRLRRVQRRRGADGCGAARGAPSATRTISRAATHCVGGKTRCVERARAAYSEPAKLASGAPRTRRRGQNWAQCCPRPHQQAWERDAKRQGGTEVAHPPRANHTRHASNSAAPAAAREGGKLPSSRAPAASQPASGAPGAVGLYCGDVGLYCGEVGLYAALSEHRSAAPGQQTL